VSWTRAKGEAKSKQLSEIQRRGGCGREVVAGFVERSIEVVPALLIADDNGSIVARGFVDVGTKAVVADVISVYFLDALFLPDFEVLGFVLVDC
jgi:hypothetical protein